MLHILARCRFSAKRPLPLACLVLGFFLASIWGASAQNFAEGRSAYNLGDYPKAFLIWHKLARRGDPKAQASIGYLYLRGLGVPMNHEMAALWYREAALQGQAEALYFLGTLHLKGHGVPRNNVRAFVACELALTKGVAAGLSCRDSAAEDMTEAQLREAGKAVVRWYAKEEAARREQSTPPPTTTAMREPP